MGLNPTLANKIYEHIDLTWHHLDDLGPDLKSGFQLVIERVHKATIVHMGSNKQIKKLLEIIQIN